MMAGHNQDREILSALFDGELQGDAARFALKRMDHDAQWRETCGRWQLAGDVLRGHATTAAPHGFAARVGRAIALAEQAPVVAPVAMNAAEPRQAMTASRRPWIGGAALAASVAVVAMLVARPFSQEPASTSTPVSQVATRDAPEPASPSQAPSPAPPATQAAVSAGGLAATSIAVAEVPRRAIERRSSRSQGQRAALRRQSPAAGLAASNSATLTVASAAIEPAAADATIRNPFHPRTDEIATRPWPRAVLPNAPAAGALTANYGSASSPSFYPFEPRLPMNEAAPPPSGDAPQP